MKEALKLALEALEHINDRFDLESVAEDATTAITAIKEALAQPEPEYVLPGGGYVPPVPLAQPEQEPVVWGMRSENGQIYDVICHEEHADCAGAYTVPLYTAPPKRPWVGLTYNEIALISADYKYPQGFAQALEAKLKEKNT